MKLKSLLLLPLAILSLAACDDSKSYSELLEDEDKAVNSFLANQSLPAVTVKQVLSSSLKNRLKVSLFLQKPHGTVLWKQNVS